MRLLAVLVLVPLVASASPRKVALTGVTAGAGIDATSAATLSDAVAAELRKLPGITVITPQEIGALLSHEQQRALVGCEDDQCISEIGGALGVDELVSGSIGKLGRSWLVHLKRLDVAKARALNESDRRLVNGSIDDVLDQLPAMARELFGQPAVAVATAPTSKPATTTPAPPNGADVDAKVEAAVRARLELFTDGHGRFVAFDPQGDTFDSFFAGDEHRLYAQRVFGGGSDGDGDFSRNFWEPRVAARWQAELDRKAGKVSLQCGDHQLPLTEVAAKSAKKILAKARLLAPRWQRQAFAIARDDAGTWYFVDRAREPEGNRDFRLFVGNRAHLAYVPLTDAMVDPGGQLFVSDAGRLSVKPADKKASWISGPTTTPLVFLDVEDEARFAYTDLGVYSEPLGTACDGKL